MANKVLFVILLVFGMFVAAPAAGAPLWQDAFQSGPPVAQPPVQTPDPARLPANWWRYFEVEGAQLDEHIIATSILLSERLEKLPAGIAPAAQPLIDRIEAQLLDIVERLREEQRKLKEKQIEVASSQKAIKGAQQSIDTRMAAYLGTSPGDPNRVLLGLGIMVDRLSVGVAEEQLRIADAELGVKETLVNQLLAEKEIAAERLRIQPGYLESLAAEIKQAEANLEQARERLTKQQTTALSVVADTQAEKAAAPYRQQQVSNAEVLKAIAEVRLIRLRMQRQLAELLLSREQFDAKALRQQFTDWNEQLVVIREEIPVWLEDSQRERDRADAALAAASSGEGGVESLIRVVFRDRLNLARQTLAALDNLETLLVQTDMLRGLVERELARREGGVRDWLARSELSLKQAWETLVGWGSQSLFKIKDTPVTAFGLLRVVVIIFFAWLISYWWRRVLHRLGEHREDSIHAIYTVGRLTHYVLITLGLIIGLSSIGLDFTNLAVMAGAIGIGIGFGLQSIVRNFISGIILLFERTLKVGDFVELASGVEGEVRAINVRSTVINTNDNLDVVVPNSQFIDHEVTNWTLLENNRRIHVPFRIAYDADTELVQKAVLEAADAVPHTLKTKKPGVWLADFGDNGLECELVVWLNPAAVKRPGAVNAAYRWAIEAALRKYGIKVPLPQRYLHLSDGLENLAKIEGRIPLEEVKPLLEKASGGG